MKKLNYDEFVCDRSETAVVLIVFVVIINALSNALAKKIMK